MADTAISGLAELAARPAADDEFVVVDTSAGATKRIVAPYVVAVGYPVDSSETDQGVAGSGRSVKDFVDDIGTSKSATILFPHSSTGNTTTYTFSTSETIPSNITVQVENGAVIDIDSGVVLTINGPLEAGRYKIFSGDGTRVLSTRILPEWYGMLPSIETDAQAILNLNALTDITVDASASVVPIVFGAATYFIEYGTSRTLELLDDLTFIGQGKLVTILEWREVGGTGSTNGLMKDDGNGISNLEFRNIGFDNTDVTPGTYYVIGTIIWLGLSGTGSDAIESYNITIDDCRFVSRSRSMHICQAENVSITNSEFVVASGVDGVPSIDVMNGSKYVRIIGNYVQTQSADSMEQCCINVIASDMVIANNVVGTSTYSAGSILCEGGTNILVANNLVDASEDQVNAGGIFIANCTDITVVGNEVKGNASPTAECRGIISNRGNSNVTIESNKITNFWSSIYVGRSSATTMGSHYINYNVMVNPGNVAFLLDCDSPVTYLDAETTFIGNVVTGSNNHALFYMPTDAEQLTIDGNVGIEIRPQSLSEDHPTIIGHNMGGGLTSTTTTLREGDFDSLSNAQYAMIEWTGPVVYVTSPAMDLSGADTTHELFGYNPDKKYYIANISMYYSEASSGDAGVVITPRMTDLTGVVRSFTAYTSEVSKAIRSRVNHRVITNAYYDTPAFHVIRCAGSKTGAGEIYATYTLVEQ